MKPIAHWNYLLLLCFFFFKKVLGPPQVEDLTEFTYRAGKEPAHGLHTRPGEPSTVCWRTTNVIAKRSTPLSTFLLGLEAIMI